MIFYPFRCAFFVELGIATLEGSQILFVCQHGLYFELDVLLDGLIVDEQLLLFACKVEN